MSPLDHFLAKFSQGIHISSGTYRNRCDDHGLLSFSFCPLLHSGSFT